MDAKILVPSMGESIIEATVVHWFKKVGDQVVIGEPLLELETNKANLDVGSEHSGTLTSIEKPEGQDVRVGETLGVIAVGEAVPAGAAVQPPVAEKREAPAEPSRTGEAAPKGGAVLEDKVTPVARRIAQENKIDLAQIAGSGPGGKVLKEDVEKFLAGASRVAPAQASAPATRPAEAMTQRVPAEIPSEQRPETIPHMAEPAEVQALQPVIPSAGTGQPARQDGREERIRFSRRRRTIAQKLVETQNAAAMLTTFNDVDMSAVMRIRQARKEQFKQKYGVGLGIVSFFVKAVLLALKDFPRLNAEVQGDEMVIKHYYDIGIAIGDEEGLVVPVLHEADRLTMVEIEKAIQNYVQKTKDHKLSLPDLMGGTFTITNGGVFGSLLSTPILNGPEVGILGLHRIEDRPVVVNGEVVVRPMMYLALSYDHRIVDGREAVQFLARVKEAIEDPEILLLGL